MSAAVPYEIPEQDADLWGAGRVLYPSPSGTAPAAKLVFDTVRDRPGITTREIAGLLGDSRGAIQFHLSRLMWAGWVEHVGFPYRWRVPEGRR